MSAQQPRFVQITHADVIAAERAEMTSEQTRTTEADRDYNQRRRARTFAAIDPIAPADKRYRAGIRVEERGNVAQTFSCHCGKHSHGHEGPDHADPFASIIEPTRFEAEPPAWAKKLAARSDDADLRRQASALAKRVQDARAQSPKTDRKRR
ncbi:hypothetical protein [Curtobacterium sp. SAFR-003]|uniref:hypothetical protein n=1 Tax=Curtobacterium sp. SAFR-003 TaxID=3387276 RepID=UPI003F7F5EA6